jgi:predicted acylesterase/phospholipase RssA
LPQVRIGTKWYSDGGLLGALPSWAAAELGATRIIGLQALPQPPSWWLGHGVRIFRAIAGHNPAVPAGVEVQEIRHAESLGSVRDTIQWKRSNIERWLDQGAEDAAAALAQRRL